MTIQKYKYALSNTDKDDYTLVNYQCKDCGELCNIESQAFSYSGTHCNNGQSGTHNDGAYASDCCDSEYELSDSDSERLGFGYG